MRNITQEQAKKYLSYNKETGIFKWKVAKGRRVRPGHIAGSLNKGYIRIRIDGISYHAHQLAWLFVYGVWPTEVDHEDHNKENNAIGNLRNVSRSQNAQNQLISSRNTSGVVGVSWFKPTKKWRAYICSKGKLMSLGYYEEFEDAKAARKKAEKRLGFHPNHGKTAL